MKKIAGFLLIIIVSLFVMSVSFAQDMGDEDYAAGPKDMRPKAMMTGGMHGMGMPMKDAVTPEQLASYDEKTHKAWREIEDMKLARRTNAYIAIGAAFAIAIAVLGGAFAQGRVAAAAMDGIARNPDALSKIFTPLIISLALIESLVIYALVVAILLQGKL